MKKSARSCAILQILMEHPNESFSLGWFAERFGCAKSSISEDLKVLKEASLANGSGVIETTAGVKGGVRYIPVVSSSEASEILNRMKTMLEEPDRILGSGFLYTSDVMFDPAFARGCARIFAKCFASVRADVVVTVEIKGIATALFTAELLGLPLTVIRRESKVSDGSTISINYFSGSSERIQQMSLSKRAIRHGSRAIIIDDFMRGGGSVKGICDMLAEFDCEVAGAGVILSMDEAQPKRVGDYVPLLVIDSKALAAGNCKISINTSMI